MADTATAPASPKKVKRTAKPKAPAAHPKYSEMICCAIKALKERGGSSRRAIQKYVMANFNVGKDEKVVNTHLKMAFRRMAASKALVQVKGSFKVGEAAKAAKPKAKKAAKPKKPASPKKKKTAKKPAAAPAVAASGDAPAAKPKKAAKAKKPASPKKAKAPKAKKAVKPKKVTAKKTKAAKKSPKKAAK